MTRRRFGFMLSAAVSAMILQGGNATQIAAQDAATPAADALGGYPELKITATDTELTLPAQIPAGRFLVTIENQATLGESAPNFILLAEGQTTEELLSGPADPAAGLPDWFFTATIVGAPIAPAGTTAQAIVDFAPGRYAVSGESFQPPVTLEVVPGTPVATSDPVAETALTIGDGALTGVPGRVSPGRHLWRVTAVGDLPHRFQLYSFPEPITRDQLLAALEALGLPEGATPPAGLPDLGQAVQLGGLGVQSAGLTGWPVLDLTAGTHIAMCPIQDGEAGALHGLLGEVAVFTVA